MAVKKPIMLDETGKAIVEALTQKEITQQRIAEINAAKDEAIDEIDAKLPGIESKVNEINETLLHQQKLKSTRLKGFNISSDGKVSSDATFDLMIVSVSSGMSISANSSVYAWFDFVPSKNGDQAIDKTRHLTAIENTEVISGAKYIVYRISATDSDVPCYLVNIAENVNDIEQSLADYGQDNKFDGQLGQGWYSSSNISTITASNTNVSSKNFIDVVPNKTVKLVVPNTSVTAIIIFFADANGNYISDVRWSNQTGGSFTAVAPSNAKKCKFTIGNATSCLVDTVGRVSVYVDSDVDNLNNSLLHKHITVQNQNDGSAKTLATLICESIKNSENGTYICNGSWVNHSRGYVAQVSMTTYYDNTRKCINGLITAYDGNSYIFIADVINGTVSNVKVSNSIAMS